MLAPQRPRRVILVYHSLGANPPALSEERFRRQVAWLAANATVVPLDAIIGDENMHGLKVALTFDDGYASLHDRVAPILAEYGATATVYLNSGWMGETTGKNSDATLGHYPDDCFLTWSQVEVLAGAGWTIGSHGVEHLDLTRQDALIVARELGDSKREIEARLGRPCQHFAYTWGRFTPSVQRAVMAAGYGSAVSCLHGPLLSSSDMFALPRIDVCADYELRDFVDAVMGRWDYLGYKQRITRRLT